jgi:RHS repeat-associated protein
MTSMTTDGTTTNFTYDNWGRTVSKYITGSYSATYTYGPAHMLSTVTSDFLGEEDVSYAIGGDGMRRSRTTSSEETWYNWAGFMVISEEDDDAGAGNLTRTYIGHTMAHADGTYFGNNDYAYYFRDHLGSTRRLRDHDKNSDGQYEYTPYGEVYAESGATITHKYAMLEWDAAVQMHFAPFRYYSSGAARWTSPDPLGLMGGLNLYYYAGNSPSMIVDPLGLKGSKCDCSDSSILGAGISFVMEVGNNVLEWISSFLKRQAAPGAPVPRGATAASGLQTVMTGASAAMAAPTIYEYVHNVGQQREWIQAASDPDALFPNEIPACTVDLTPSPQEINRLRKCWGINSPRAQQRLEEIRSTGRCTRWSW